MPSRRLDKKSKIIQLLKDGETSPVIIANKVKCNVVYVYRVKNELLQELLRSQAISQAIPIPGQLPADILSCPRSTRQTPVCRQ